MTGAREPARMGPPPWWERERKALTLTIERCVMTGTPHEVNLGVPKHFITASALRRTVYNTALRNRRPLPVVFKDGSHSAPFPVGVLSAEDGPIEESKADLLSRAAGVLKLGTMTLRHPELDYLVDIYVSRNTELAGDNTHADKEALAYTRTLALLSEPVVDELREIWLYQTGFEPMIVGVFRGITEVLRRRHERRLPRLLIRPWLYAPDNPDAETYDHDEEHIDTGKKYSLRSPGARVECYEPTDPWY